MMQARLWTITMHLKMFSKISYQINFRPFMQLRFCIWTILIILIGVLLLTVYYREHRGRQLMMMLSCSCSLSKRNLLYYYEMVGTYFFNYYLLQKKTSAFFMEGCLFNELWYRYSYNIHYFYLLTGKEWNLITSC